MFESIVGHSSVKTMLAKVIQEKKFANAYLFCGPKGVGKFSTSMEFACAIQGEKFRHDSYLFRNPDLTVVYPFLKKDLTVTDTYLNALSSNLQSSASKSLKSEKNPFPMFEFSGNESIPVDLVREIIIHVSKMTYIADRRVVIVRNAEMMRKEAANSFLKILEEPPASTMFILTTDNINIILPTIVSRCRIVKFGYLSENDMNEYYRSLGYSDDKIKAISWTYEGVINERSASASAIDRDFILDCFINGKKKELLANLSQYSKKSDGRYYAKMFLKILLKYLSDSVIDGGSFFDVDSSNQLMDEIVNVEHDIKLNFQPAHIISYIMDLARAKDEVNHVRQS